MVEYDYDIAGRRLDAYVRMLMEAYGLDDRGMADLLGMHYQTWTKFRRAEFGKKGANAIMRLAGLTGLDVRWLLGEVDDCEVAR